ncbi:hypothetical protein NFHSH190041_28060 [Shewanella sp. NFH-SH190041]|uniref:DUF333 domain-containing protein n=1 Tax=Shewanella sp. NFH-SH190041 TaxID=2950245 RepID=UPI0021C2F04D|nr:DUF333 domain-containing protein [Shewanella sp. NFH-SH190041]BDM65354.1 hypothetical protein NFHSH190041_28060 [Shewanella sp. NFH-SH190041]
MAANIAFARVNIAFGSMVCLALLGGCSATDATGSHNAQAHSATNMPQHQSQTSHPHLIGMPNPAAVFCEQIGGQYQLIDTPQGQAGQCFYLGQNYDAWQLFRSHHQPTGTQTSPAENHQQQ